MQPAAPVMRMFTTGNLKKKALRIVRGAMVLKDGLLTILTIAEPLSLWKEDMQKLHVRHVI